MVWPLTSGSRNIRLARPLTRSSRCNSTRSHCLVWRLLTGHWQHAKEKTTYCFTHFRTVGSKVLGTPRISWVQVLSRISWHFAQVSKKSVTTEIISDIQRSHFVRERLLIFGPTNHYIRNWIARILIFLHLHCWWLYGFVRACVCVWSTRRI